MWTLSGSPWASSTQSGPGWGPCGLCPHMHRRGVPSFARCLGGEGAFLQQREHWPCPGISDRRPSLALTVSMYIAGSAERELGAPFKSQQRNSRLASWRGTLDGVAVAAGGMPGLGRHRGGGHCAAAPVAGSGHGLLLLRSSTDHRIYPLKSLATVCSQWLQTRLSEDTYAHTGHHTGTYLPVCTNT